MFLASFTTSSIITFLSIVFLLTTVWIELTNPRKFVGLRRAIAGGIVVSSGILLLSLTTLLNSNQFRDGLIIIGSLLLVFGYSHNTSTIIKMINNKKRELFFGLFTIVVLIGILILGILNLTLSFTIVTTITLLSMLLLQVLYLNIGTSGIIKTEWFWFSIINLSAIFIGSIYTFERIYFNNGYFDIFSSRGVSILLAFLFLSKLNIIGLLVVLVRKIYVERTNLKSLLGEMCSFTTSINILIDNNTKKIHHVNDLFTEKFKYKETDVLDVMLFEKLFVTKDEYNYIISDIKKNSGIKEYQVRLKDVNGNVVHSVISLTSANRDKKRYIICSIYDVTNTVIHNEKYEYLATHDELTRLPNRRKMIEVFELKRAINKPFCVMMLDVDKFKDINDNYGHLVGDELLTFISYKLKAISNQNLFVARYGGDEFVFMSNCLNKAELNKTIDDILNVFKEPFTINNTTISSAVSIGVAIYPQHGKSLYELIDKADKSLYVAKKTNGSHLVMYEKGFEKP